MKRMKKRMKKRFTRILVLIYPESLLIPTCLQLEIEKKAKKLDKKLKEDKILAEEEKKEEMGQQNLEPIPFPSPEELENIFFSFLI